MGDRLALQLPVIAGGRAGEGLVPDYVEWIATLQMLWHCDHRRTARPAWPPDRILEVSQSHASRRDAHHAREHRTIAADGRGGQIGGCLTPPASTLVCCSYRYPASSTLH